MFWGGIQYNQSFTLSMSTYSSSLDLRPFLVPALWLLAGGRLGLAAVAGLYTWPARSRVFGRIWFGTLSEVIKFSWVCRLSLARFWPIVCQKLFSKTKFSFGLTCVLFSFCLSSNNWLFTYLWGLAWIFHTQPETILSLNTRCSPELLSSI